MRNIENNDSFFINKTGNISDEKKNFHKSTQLFENLHEDILLIGSSSRNVRYVNNKQLKLLVYPGEK